MTRRISYGLAFFLLWISGALAEPQSVEIPVVPRYDLFEVSFDVPHQGVHPDDVVLRAELRAPSGEVISVGGFASRGGFKVRFAPRELGEHSYAVYASKEEEAPPIREGKFVAVESENPGYVGPHPEDPYRLAFTSEAPFLLLGENRINVYDPSWNYQQMDAPQYIAYMASHGMTTLRVFLFNDAESEERADGEQLGCLEPSLGRFDEDVAEELDRIFAAAQEHGIYVILTVYALGFTPEETWKSWEDNPFSTHRGGPATHNWEIFLDPKLHKAAQRRLGYLSDRYGYSTSLLAIDLLNEPEWDGNIGEEVWIPWARKMADFWSAKDPYGHLITVGSVGLHWNVEGDERPWYADPRNDLVQWHIYGPEVYDVHALAREMTRRIKETRIYKKPVLIGEFAYGGEDPRYYDHTHVGLFSAFFSGAGVLAHSAPPFNIDSDALMTPKRARHFKVLRELIQKASPEQDLRPRPESPRTLAGGTTVWSLGDKERRHLWLLGPKDGYGETVQGVTLRLSDLLPGAYTCRFYDDETGELIHTARFSTTTRRATIEVPPFTRHLAAHLLPDAP